MTETFATCCDVVWRDIALPLTFLLLSSRVLCIIFSVNKIDRDIIRMYVQFWIVIVISYHILSSAHYYHQKHQNISTNDRTFLFMNDFSQLFRPKYTSGTNLKAAAAFTVVMGITIPVTLSFATFMQLYILQQLSIAF